MTTSDFIARELTDRAVEAITTALETMEDINPAFAKLLLSELDTQETELLLVFMEIAETAITRYRIQEDMKDDRCTIR